MDEHLDDQESIVATVLDYFEGWFEGDSDRMRRALHPALAKRALEEDRESLDETTTAWMVEATEKGLGRGRGGDDRIEVTVEDVHGDIASATVRSAPYREYVHLVNTPAGWRIVNTLWAPS